MKSSKRKPKHEAKGGKGNDSRLDCSPPVFVGSSGEAKLQADGGR